MKQFSKSSQSSLPIWPGNAGGWGPPKTYQMRDSESVVQQSVLTSPSDDSKHTISEPLFYCINHENQPNPMEVENMRKFSLSKKKRRKDLPEEHWNISLVKEYPKWLPECKDILWKGPKCQDKVRKGHKIGPCLDELWYFLIKWGVWLIKSIQFCKERGRG